MDLDTPISEISGIRLPERQSRALEEAGIRRVGDLAFRFPKRYENRLEIDPVPADPDARPRLLSGTVVSARQNRFGKQVYAGVELELAGEPWKRVTCRWFGMPFMAKALPAGARAFVFGTPKVVGEKLVLDHPEHEVLREGSETLQLGRLVPIPLSPRGITTRDYRELLHTVLEQLDSCADLLPPPKPGGPFAGASRLGALKTLHFPDSQAELAAARRYLALEWMTGLQLSVLQRRDATSRIEKSRPVADGETLLRSLIEELAFEPTGDQRKAIGEIARDLGASAPMNRLLHGDVGSGKTLVAAGALALAVGRGGQAALMAPTQILAEQHFATMSSWFQPLGIGVGLLTSEREEGAGEAAQIVIGTHALFHSKDESLRPDLVIIDEQHKFGVAQREALIGRSGHPDVLVLTATPIPRTMVLTAYGDLEVSTIREKPAGRSPIRTAARHGARVSDITRFLKRELARGRQAYLLFPQIDGGENADAKKSKPPALEEEFPRWQRRLRPHAVDLVHGALPAEEREAAMGRFRSGETAALLCTTVIEVGVDVPNATVMCIFGAGRFGLAQLHQLRGRVGRGRERSFCLLLPDRDNAETMEKLAILERTDDGFAIAEADLARRGPGEVLGISQSGHGTGAAAAFAKEFLDPEFCLLAQRLAARIEREDPGLQQPRNQALLELARPRRTSEGALQ